MTYDVNKSGRILVKARVIKRPGARGGRFYHTKEGSVRYGQQPAPQSAPTSVPKLPRGLTYRAATTQDQQRWPGCDRVLADANTETPLWPGESLRTAVAQWERAVR